MDDSFTNPWSLMALTKSTDEAMRHVRMKKISDEQEGFDDD